MAVLLFGLSRSPPRPRSFLRRRFVPSVASLAPGTSERQDEVLPVMRARPRSHEEPYAVDNRLKLAVPQRPDDDEPGMLPA